MPCNHRFINDLLPEHNLKYLFIGTFNPCWDRLSDNANWFYGRKNNDFWFILPQVLKQDSLMSPEFRNNKNFLKRWCFQNGVGITDLIESIQDGDINNETHKELITSVKDDAFDIFHDIKATKIQGLISSNASSLKGVYLTRFEHTLPHGGILHKLWDTIANHCISLNINVSSLVTPSRQYRAINRVEKLKQWASLINVD